MAYQFTPGAQRALAAAAGWASRNDCDDLQPPELLLGLLDEAECRAAAMLAAHGIDAAAVRGRWPELRRYDAGDRAREAGFSWPVEMALAEAARRLGDYPPPLVLATEHLLLGLVASRHELSEWLAERGFSADALEAEIHKLAGHDASPLPLDDIDAGKIPQASAPAGAVAPPVAREPGEAEQRAAPTNVHGPSQRIGLLRVLDAAANRAREGLRVVEDYVRFVLDDAHLTGELKRLRHELASALERIPAADRLAARDTAADVGTDISTAAELLRPDPAAVAAANFKRLEESLRSLEEFGKVLDPELGTAVEAMRYRCYTLEKAVAKTRESSRRLAQARLYVLVDGQESLDDFVRLAESLVAAGVHVLQLRDKQLADRELIERARTLRRICAGRGTLAIINDRPDIAALVRADGVHIGQDELCVKDARTIVGPGVLVGVSTHSLAQARQAVLDGADYIGVGPTFASATKSFAASQLTGLDLLGAVASEIRLPAFAIGGITHNRLRAVLATGVSRVAVSGAIASAADPASAARELLAMLNGQPRS